MILYEFTIEIDLVKLSDKVGSFVNELNANLSRFGIDDRVSCRHTVGTIVATVECELFPEQEIEMQKAIEESLNKLNSQFSFCVNKPRRKSGNAQPSVE